MQISAALWLLMHDSGVVMHSSITVLGTSTAASKAISGGFAKARICTEMALRFGLEPTTLPFPFPDTLFLLPELRRLSIARENWSSTAAM